MNRNWYEEPIRDESPSADNGRIIVHRRTNCSMILGSFVAQRYTDTIRGTIKLGVWGKIRNKIIVTLPRNSHDRMLW